MNVNHSLQHFSSLRGKGKKLTPDLEEFLQLNAAQNTIFAVLKFVITAQFWRGQKFTKYDVTRYLSEKFSEVSPNRSVCDTKKKG